MSTVATVGVASGVKPASGQEVRVKPATGEEVEAFVLQNKRWLPDDAEKVLRSMNAADQRRVICAGSMSSVQNPIAVLQARVRKAKDLEEAAARSGGAIPAALLGLESKLAKPATSEELEAFVKSNDRWLEGEAVELLRAMSPVDQRRVISAGTMSGCRDPVAVIQTRVKKAREMELELENLAAGKKPLLHDEKPGPATQSFREEEAAAHLYAPPEEVGAMESKFASSVDSARGGSAGQTLMGDAPGVGGVVEMLKAKYGCLKGQRARVIGETQSLLQFEGGKTAPKAHEGSGWKWVIREEEESKQSAAEAQLAALQKAAALQAEQVAAHKAAELARAQAEAKAYAAAQEAMKAKVRHAGPDSEDGGSSSSSCPSESSLAAKKKKKKPQKDSDSGSGSTMSRKRKSTKKAKPKDTKEKVARALKSKAKESSRSRKDLDSKARKKPKRRASSSSGTCLKPKKSKR